MHPPALFLHLFPTFNDEANVPPKLNGEESQRGAQGAEANACAWQTGRQSTLTGVHSLPEAAIPHSHAPLMSDPWAMSGIRCML